MNRTHSNRAMLISARIDRLNRVGISTENQCKMTVLVQSCFVGECEVRDQKPNDVEVSLCHQGVGRHDALSAIAMSMMTSALVFCVYFLSDHVESFWWDIKHIK